MQVLYSVYFDLNFQGQTFQVAILNKAGKMQTLLLPSDRKSGICQRTAPLQMLHIVTLTYIFKVTNFEMWISQKTARVSEKYSIMTYRFWYLPSNGTIANVVLHHFDLHFQGQIIYLLCIGNTNCAVPVDVPGRLASTCMALAVELLLLFFLFLEDF